LVIAVQKGLDHIKEMLRERGLDIVTLGEYNYPVDAILYTGYGISSAYVSNNNIPNFNSADINRVGNSRNYGVLMVNIEGKTIDEIVSSLEKRVYSNLF
jgi:hypothetical protein